MVDKKLLDYVKNELSRGVEKETLTKVLSDAGWEISDIEEAFDKVEPKAQKKRFSRKLLPIFIIIFLIFAAFLALIYAYSQLSSPERILGKTIENQSKVKSFKYDLEVELKFDEQMPFTYESLNNLKINLNGALDFSDPDGTIFELLTQVLLNNKDAGKVTLKNIKDNYYLKISENVLEDALNLGVVRDQWIKLDPATLSRDLGISIETKAATENESKRFINLLKDYPIIEIVEELNKEKVAQVDSYHFRFSVNNENFKKYLKEVFGRSFDQEIGKMSLPANHGGEIWIGRKDFLLRKLTYSFSFDGGTFLLTAVLDSYNEAINIEEPGEYKSLEEVLPQILPPIMEKLIVPQTGS